MIQKHLRIVATAMAFSVLSACGSGDSGSGTDRSAASTKSAAPQFKLAITSTTDVPGTFGSIGAYQKITGTLTGEVDPGDVANGIIQDLSLAPRNANGMVEYRSDFILFKPKDMSKANGVLRYDAPNRGTPVDIDTYFASRGYVFLSGAWQGDVPSVSGKVALQVPVAKNPDGSSITGPYRSELLPSVATTDSLPLPGGAYNYAMQPYAPASLDNTQPGYVLTRRVNEGDPRQLVPASDWRFAKCDAGQPFPGTPDGGNVCVKGGWDPAYMYELVYVAKDPKVMGVGLATLRDMIDFFRGKTADSQGVANPVAGAIRYTIGSGVSQSGAFLKTFVHLGFNKTLSGAKVFDGVFDLIGANQNNINMRFAIPGGAAGVRSDHTAYGIAGTRALASDSFDDLTQQSGGIFSRCTATDTCPKFFVGLTGNEFWTSTVSPLLTDALGTRDLRQPDNARIYFFASAHHLLGLPSMTGTQIAALLGPMYNGMYKTNGNTSVTLVVRALYQDMEQWVVNGTQPPDNQLPRIDNGTLVRPNQVNFPAIPGMRFTGLANTFPMLSWGPQYEPQDETGVATQLPPSYAGRDYGILVPQVDADGNDLGGIRSLDVAVPVATNTGWNTTAFPGRIDQAGLSGSMFPFAKTDADRLASGDPRLSVIARYGNQAGYIAALRAAANDLVSRRFMLQTDADVAVSAAQAAPVLP
ncbi:hypothetical protein NOV72_01755 [Caballeronia novacaledonica]|uniref:Alpha/beta hydrolase domain-containing protein n=1 Tax=Caballeronia novacaledonica TaxID=1544861 RepID=A0A2U3I308_9BURK|nr:alpha/beta hydrolase domain-containing protein [Caballeronia novacaledonica]SPB14513.1 hypothetical protein NOV72_01755 [Caballeronia novacaledonica]